MSAGGRGRAVHRGIRPEPLGRPLLPSGGGGGAVGQCESKAPSGAEGCSHQVVLPGSRATGVESRRRRLRRCRRPRHSSSGPVPPVVAPCPSCAQSTVRIRTWYGRHWPGSRGAQHQWRCCLALVATAFAIHENRAPTAVRGESPQSMQRSQLLHRHRITDSGFRTLAAISPASRPINFWSPKPGSGHARIATPPGRSDARIRPQLYSAVLACAVTGRVPHLTTGRMAMMPWRRDVGVEPPPELRAVGRRVGTVGPDWKIAVASKLPTANECQRLADGYRQSGEIAVPFTSGDLNAEPDVRRIRR